MQALLQLIAFLESLGANAGPVIAAVKVWVTATEALYQAIIAVLPAPAPTPAPVPGPLKEFEAMNAMDRLALENRVVGVFGDGTLLALLLKFAPQIIALLIQLGILKPPAPTP